MAWGDDDGKTLYLCARSGLYRMRVNVEGIRPLEDSIMKAIELSSLDGFDGLRAIETGTPKPVLTEVLIQLKASGVNFAELELTKGSIRQTNSPRSSWDSRLL